MGHLIGFSVDPMAGRDARPTVVNITFYLKNPIWADHYTGRTHRSAPYNNGYTDGVMTLYPAY